VSVAHILFIAAVPTAMVAVVALVIVCRAEKKDLPAIARALGSWFRRKQTPRA
jgi:Sec-independent protein translocase protein TatA